MKILLSACSAFVLYVVACSSVQSSSDGHCMPDSYDCCSGDVSFDWVCDDGKPICNGGSVTPRAQCTISTPTRCLPPGYTCCSGDVSKQETCVGGKPYCPGTSVIRRDVDCQIPTIPEDDAGPDARSIPDAAIDAKVDANQ